MFLLSKLNTGCTGHTATFWPKQLVHVRQTQCLCRPRACWPETEVTSFALLVHCLGCWGENGCSADQRRRSKRILKFKGTTLYWLTDFATRFSRPGIRYFRCTTSLGAGREGWWPRADEKCGSRFVLLCVNVKKWHFLLKTAIVWNYHVSTMAETLFMHHGS